MAGIQCLRPDQRTNSTNWVWVKDKLTIKVTHQHSGSTSILSSWWNCHLLHPNTVCFDSQLMFWVVYGSHTGQQYSRCVRTTLIVIALDGLGNGLQISLDDSKLAVCLIDYLVDVWVPGEVVWYIYPEVCSYSYSSECFVMYSVGVIYGWFWSGDMHYFTL